MLKGKTIILGVTSSIAIYKSCEIVRRLKERGAEVWVVMTSEATKLITPLTFRTLSGNPVITDLFPSQLSQEPFLHISLSERASALVVAPATANIISKLATGIADDALTTIALSFAGKKLIVPAMNTKMWENPIIVKNVKTLKELKYEIMGPVEGKLACGKEGLGRMAEAGEIVDQLVRLIGLRQDLKSKHILVTAGGTREAIDPVRYISNRSSGKMGYALAQAAQERGATVTLISANVNLPSPLDIKLIKVESASEMLKAVLSYYHKTEVVIMAAAVADFCPKIKNKNKNKIFNLELEPTKDILKTISQKKGRKGKILIGFALETENLIKNAKEKLRKKNLDFIIANDPSSLEAEESAVKIIDRRGKIIDLPRLPKIEIAQRILDLVVAKS